jgi:hypothetical protein
MNSLILLIGVKHTKLFYVFLQITGAINFKKVENLDSVDKLSK